MKGTILAMQPREHNARYRPLQQQNHVSMFSSFCLVIYPNFLPYRMVEPSVSATFQTFQFHTNKNITFCRTSGNFYFAHMWSNKIRDNFSLQLPYSWIPCFQFTHFSILVLKLPWNFTFNVHNYKIAMTKGILWLGRFVYLLETGRVKLGHRFRTLVSIVEY